MVNDNVIQMATNPATVSEQAKAQQIIQAIKGGRDNGMSECAITDKVQSIH